MNETFKPLLDYGALGAIVAVFLYYGIKTLNTLAPALLEELKNLNKTMRLILKSLVETLPRGAKQRLLEEYLQEFSEPACPPARAGADRKENIDKEGGENDA